MTRRSHGKREHEGGNGRSPSLDRVEQYRNPEHSANWDGRSTQKAIDRWSDRASRYSGESMRVPDRGLTEGGEKDQDPPRVFDTGGPTENFDTTKPSRSGRR